MVSKYSIVQYLPDPLTDERINIGVIAFTTEEVKVKFLHKWDRVQCFASRNIDFVKEFSAKAYQEIPSKLLLTEKNLTISLIDEKFHNVYGDWINCIQFTKSKTSLKDIEETFEYACKRFLFEKKEQKIVKPRNRQDAKRATVSGIKEALSNLGVKELLRTNYHLPGHKGKHGFDVIAANGTPFLAAHGISFEVNEPRLVLDALAWRIEDIKLLTPSFPIGVLILPPVENTDTYPQLSTSYNNAVSVYKNMGADVLLENQIQQWASDHIKTVI